jgi:hypothetical protein
MTALAVGLALVPLVVTGTIPGQEIARPMAIVILGGLGSMLVYNLLIVPRLFSRFGPSLLPLPADAKREISSEDITTGRETDAAQPEVAL